MALNKSFRLFHKLDPPGGKYSVILEERNIEESLLFESRVVGVLSPSEVDSLKKTCNYTRYSPHLYLFPAAYYSNVQQKSRFSA